MLALLQVVNLQEEGRINGSATSTGCTAVVRIKRHNQCLYIQRLITTAGNKSGECVSREEFEHTRAETETLKHELNSWQNTNITILKTYLLNQGTFTILKTYLLNQGTLLYAQTEQQTHEQAETIDGELNNLHTAHAIYVAYLNLYCG